MLRGRLSTGSCMSRGGRCIDSVGWISWRMALGKGNCFVLAVGKWREG